MFFFNGALSCCFLRRPAASRLIETQEVFVFLTDVELWMLNLIPFNAPCVNVTYSTEEDNSVSTQMFLSAHLQRFSEDHNVILSVSSALLF